VQDNLKNIESLYLTYSGVNLETNEVVLTAGTVTDSMQLFLQNLQAGHNISTNAVMQQSLAIVDAWANVVTDNVKPLFNELQDLSNKLAGVSAPLGSPLVKCSKAVFANWQLYAAQKSPVDDRQYFDLIYGWVWSLINLQAQGMQMIQAAYQYK
jgi:hypothetical protein